MGISPKINKRGGSNNRVGGRIPQKLIKMEVLIGHVVGKIFSKRLELKSAQNNLVVGSFSQNK